MNAKSTRAVRIGTTIDVLGESPVWCSESQRLCWVDIRAPALRRLDPATGALKTFTLPDLCGAVMLSRDHRLALPDRPQARLHPHARGRHGAQRDLLEPR
jgi:sugar lactone lactonase YvrE